MNDGDLDAHLIVRAAMAHLNLVSVHPFRDGNGRISRIVQSLVLARGGLPAPEFVSIEEYLAANTPAYHAALGETQGGTYQPERDAMPFVRFCVTAASRCRADQPAGQRPHDALPGKRAAAERCPGAGLSRRQPIWPLGTGGRERPIRGLGLALRP
jgi:hypothetical protein